MYTQADAYLALVSHHDLSLEEAMAEAVSVNSEDGILVAVFADSSEIRLPVAA